jgi:hypothetical protein
MDSGQTSDDILGHFDRPQTLELPDFEWVEEVISFDSAARESEAGRSLDPPAERFIEIPRDTRRGVCWVLAWAGGLAVLTFAATVLVEFAYVFATERALSIAAKAGAMEATLPRATYRSVTAAVERRLTQYPGLVEQLHLSLLQNGVLVQTQVQQHEGDHFAVSLSAPASRAIPDWLRKLTFWRGDPAIHAHAERQLPGRRLELTGGLPEHN